MPKETEPKKPEILPATEINITLLIWQDTSDECCVHEHRRGYIRKSETIQRNFLLNAFYKQKDCQSILYEKIN